MRTSRLVVLLSLGALATTIAVSPALADTKVEPLTDAPPDGLSRALASGQLTEAEYALERARALFKPQAVGDRFGTVEELYPRAATFVLRDLALRLDELDGDDRRAAERLLARPSDGPADLQGDGWTTTEAPESPVCEPRPTPRWCVHWVESTIDAPPPAGSGSDGIPNWIDGTAAAMAKVFDEQVDGLGFPRPQDDTDSATAPTGNPNGALDVYLADIGNDGLYGYCTSDDPDLAQPGKWDVSAYCVVDDDFAPSQFPAVSGRLANKVTLAHEVHHAEQFALDYAEDVWMMEGTATAMERVVYPGIHDNYQYLDTSHITRPGIPLDLSDPSSGTIYGNWIFFEYLSERLGGPEIMRRIWRRLDARQGHPDAYSTQGVKRVLASLDRTLRHVLTSFSLANRRPRASYDLAGLPGLDSPTRERHWLGRGAPARADTQRLNHLTSRWLTFHRRSDAPRGAELLLQLDLPRKAYGGAARALVVRRSGERATHFISLGPAGNDREVLPFGRRVRRVELVLVNAGSRFECWEGSNWSCQGEPLDDGRTYSFRASIR